MSPVARALTGSLLAVALLAGCPGQSNGPPDAGEHIHLPVTQLRFVARVGAADFRCGQSYRLGTPATDYRPRDLRLYVHDIALINDAGVAVPFMLADDGEYQQRDVALLDFEDGTAECDGGTATTHTTLRGLAGGDHYERIEFTLGVPFELNHLGPTAATPPLDVPALWTGTETGYTFLRLDGVTPGLPQGHSLHVGSTGCVPGTTPGTVQRCTAPNRVRLSIPDFYGATPETPVARTVLLDVGALLEGSDLDANTAGTAPGCESSPDDPDCAPLFQRLGLPFGATPGAPEAQRFFRILLEE